jgi:hypothetical protein
VQSAVRLPSAVLLLCALRKSMNDSTLLQRRYTTASHTTSLHDHVAREESLACVRVDGVREACAECCMPGVCCMLQGQVYTVRCGRSASVPDVSFRADRRRRAAAMRAHASDKEYRAAVELAVPAACNIVAQRSKQRCTSMKPRRATMQQGIRDIATPLSEAVQYMGAQGRATAKNAHVAKVPPA